MTAMIILRSLTDDVIYLVLRIVCWQSSDVTAKRMTDYGHLGSFHSLRYKEVDHSRDILGDHHNAIATPYVRP